MKRAALATVNAARFVGALAFGVACVLVFGAWVLAIALTMGVLACLSLLMLGCYVAAWACWRGPWALTGTVEPKVDPEPDRTPAPIAMPQAANVDAHAASVSLACRFCGCAMVVSRELAEQCAREDATGNFQLPVCGACVRRGEVARIAPEPSRPA